MKRWWTPYLGLACLFALAAIVLQHVEARVAFGCWVAGVFCFSWHLCERIARGER